MVEGESISASFPGPWSLGIGQMDEWERRDLLLRR